VDGKGSGGGAHASFHPSYRVGKAPRPEFKVGGRAYKIDPEAKSTKRVRGLSSEEFDPTTRRQRTEGFYRDTFKDHYDEYLHGPEMHGGPFRREFLHWVNHWPAGLRARWAWHHHAYLEDSLWGQWMTDPAFASAITVLQRSNTPVEDGWLPPEYANTSPAFVYNDEYMDAAYNPIPFLAVLTLKSIKPDPQNDWIGTAAAESLVSKLSATPGMFIADRQQVVGVLQDQKLKDADVVEPNLTAHIGKALDVEQVVVGSYVVDGDSVLFNLRIVNVQTGAVQEGISKTVSRDHLLREMPGLATSLTEALGFQQQDESPTPEAGAGGLKPDQPSFPPQGKFNVTYSPGAKHTVVNIQGMVVSRRGDHGDFQTYNFQKVADGTLSLVHSAGFEIWRIGPDGTIIIDRWKIEADRSKPPLLQGHLDPIDAQPIAPLGTWVERRPDTPLGDRVRTLSDDGSYKMFLPKKDETTLGKWHKEGDRIYISSETWFTIKSADDTHMVIEMEGMREYTWYRQP